MTIVYLDMTSATLFGTWWGIIGAFLGPVYIVRNTFDYFWNSIMILVKLYRYNKLEQ